MAQLLQHLPEARTEGLRSPCSATWGGKAIFSLVTVAQPQGRALIGRAWVRCPFLGQSHWLGEEYFKWSDRWPWRTESDQKNKEPSLDRKKATNKGNFMREVPKLFGWTPGKAFPAVCS